MSDFLMPSLGADMETGVLNQWLVAPGDSVARGDIVAVVETDKSDIDVEVFHPGIVRELLVSEGTRVAVGDPIARIDAPEDATRAEPVVHVPSEERRAVAALMTRSWHDIPHFHVTRRIDLGEADRGVRRFNDGRPPAERVLVTAVLLWAVVAAAGDVPEVNGWWDDDGFRPATGVDLGVVVARRHSGIEVVTLAQAQSLTVTGLMATLDEAVGRVRSGRLRSGDVAAASLTVTPLGDLGGDAVMGVIHPPQVALVGFGRVRTEPVVRGDTVVVAPVVDVTLSGDHRALDGLVAARFLERLALNLNDVHLEGTAHDH